MSSTSSSRRRTPTNASTDEAVSEALHRERLRDRPHPVSRRADHQQALRQYSGRRPDLHVQLGGGQHHPRACLRSCGQAAGLRAASEDPARARRASATARSPTNRDWSTCGRGRLIVPLSFEARRALHNGKTSAIIKHRHVTRLRRGSDRRMIRFLVTRILSAIPILFVLSVVTFAIIQAPPGDYGDYIKSMLMSQGGATDEQAQAQADAYRAAHGLNDPLPLQYVNWVGRHRHPLRLRRLALLQSPGARGGGRTPAAHDHSGAHLPRPGIAVRHYARHHCRDAAVQLGRHGAFVPVVPRHDRAAIPAGDHHSLRARLQNEFAEFRQLLLGAVRRGALVVGQVRRPREARLAGRLHRDLRRSRLQHARHARQPARRAQLAIRRDRARQGHAREPR